MSTHIENPTVHWLQGAIADLGRAHDEAVVPAVRARILAHIQEAQATIAEVERWDALIRKGAVIPPAPREITTDELHRQLILAQMDRNEAEEDRLLKLIATRGRAAYLEGKAALR